MTNNGRAHPRDGGAPTIEGVAHHVRPSSGIGASTVENAPDFRSDASPTSEGKGLALLRWRELAVAVVEDSELIGFWVAWHSAGLERGGGTGPPSSSRSALPNPQRGPPRRVSVPWIRLDLRRAWSDDIRSRLHPEAEPDL